MGSRVDRCINLELAKPPKWMKNQVVYEVMMGSVAYGVSNKASDVDIYGVCVPPKRIVFPHSEGAIWGFDKPERFDVWQQHHIKDQEKGEELDFAIYSVVKFMALLKDNNPNIVDSVFVPERCVLHCSQAGAIIRERRRSFLHKGAWHKFKGYAYSQLHKAKSQSRTGKRKAIVEEFGYDVKFAYHVVRLILEVEQILTEGDIDLERGREQLKAIRRGEWSLGQVCDWFAAKERALEALYQSSPLPYKPDHAVFKQALLDILEAHYGSLSSAEVAMPNRWRDMVADIKAIVEG